MHDHWSQWNYSTLLDNCVESPHQFVRFSSQPVEIYVNFIRVLPEIFERPLPPLTKFHSPPPILSCPNQFVPAECDFFSSGSKTQCVAFVSNTFSSVLSHKLQFQNKVAIMPGNIPAGIHELIVWLSDRGLSQRAISRTQECHNVASPKSSVVFRRPEELSKDHMGIGWGWPHQGKTMSLSESWGETWWGETDFSHRRLSG